jgi:hypothetical protein
VAVFLKDIERAAMTVAVISFAVAPVLISLDRVLFIDSSSDISVTCL